ncbi:PLP-dependent cysteine synthase family protein [Streptomyces sp. NRRL WC-3626]|uniref:PLP-dependent cysteine synthase family protein n=1 Tax=Streptomyces sp. NRRL WC-3626 TaxID=1463926 RepID=UPI0004C24CE3|nr:pyridoxal-phosphate dependent enzyme [Streptomyces sp. NRRL WC-3626]
MTTWHPDKLPGPFQALGNTPLVAVTLTTPAGRAVRVHIKLEGLNPSGSVKDRAAVSMIKAAIREERLRPGHVLLDASSGNMAGALATYGRALGVDVHVVCNDTITEAKRQMIEHFGGSVIVNDEGPYTYDGYRKCLRLLTGGHRAYCFLDQLHSPHNPAAHEHGTGPELLSQYPDARLIVGSLGSGGTVLGVARAVRAAGHPAALAAVSSVSGSRLPGVGAFDDGDYRTPFIRELRAGALVGHWPKVTSASAARTLRQVTAAGLLCGPQTGAVVSAALDLADELDLAEGIVAVSGDAGWKNWTP